MILVLHDFGKYYQFGMFYLESVSYTHLDVYKRQHMCNLNSTELAWVKMKCIIQDNNTTGDLSLDVLKKLTEMAFESATPCKWTRYGSHVIQMGDYYWEKDSIMSDITDSCIIETGGISNDKNNESASDNNNSEASETDLEITQPLTWLHEYSTFLPVNIFVIT